MRVSEMKGMLEQQVGDGVYLMPWALINIEPYMGPKDALSVINNVALINKKLEAMALIISFSARHNKWCGVELNILSKVMRAKYEDDGNFIRVDRELDVMVQDGLLEIPAYQEWWRRWVNNLNPQIVCPTMLFLEAINRIRVAQQVSKE